MVQFGSTLLPFLMAVATVNGYSWTRCTNAPQCTLTRGNSGSTTGGSTNPLRGSRFSFTGGYVFAYDTCSSYAYSSSDGYWYSTEKDGLFVSPTGYFRASLKLLASNTGHRVEEKTAAFPTLLVKIFEIFRPITLVVSVAIVAITNIWGLSL
ncbi:hypothetical protein BGAL_0465g00060 [Botrytis galanthina]|uniref:Uncharacterized protein n=1 Tax=Botrytis galanthina TaxID=278940 RepID=A0A4S8QL66_9HELO|nr:hypothetical protein BGAL_0465g00060 [Botrytis galanthina]